VDPGLAEVASEAQREFDWEAYASSSDSYDEDAGPHVAMQNASPRKAKAMIKVLFATPQGMAGMMRSLPICAATTASALELSANWRLVNKQFARTWEALG